MKSPGRVSSSEVLCDFLEIRQVPGTLSIQRYPLHQVFAAHRRSLHFAVADEINVGQDRLVGIDEASANSSNSKRVRLAWCG